MKKAIKKYVAQNVAQKPENPHSRAILTQLPKLNTRVRFPSPAPKEQPRAVLFLSGEGNRKPVKKRRQWRVFRAWG